jgi:hypothetical protein
VRRLVCDLFDALDAGDDERAADLLEQLAQPAWWRRWWRRWWVPA